MKEREKPPAVPPPEGGARREAHEPPAGTRLMNALRWALFAGLLVVAALSVGSYFVSRGPASGRQEAKKALYHCPMHPSYTSDRPGECPICGMSLEPIPQSGSAPAAHQGDVPGLTGVQITPERIQLIGVRTARVEKRPHAASLELVGFVTPDESAFHRVQIRVPGWVQELYVQRTGDFVRAGQPLLAIYSPELFQSEQEYLIELRGAGGEEAPRGSLPAGVGTTDRGAEIPAPDAHHAATTAARQRLRLLGVPEEEIRRLERERTAATRLVLRAPATGTVLEKNVVDGQYVGPDTPLFTVSDLSRVWVLADLYEMDLRRVKVGDRATFVTSGLPALAFPGRVEFVYPTFSAETRTLKVRVALANLRGQLKPGMFGKVRVSGPLAPALIVPDEAVVHAGDQNYVFVVHVGGHFEPRSVRTGSRSGEHIEILSGVAEGDTVVASASFLIDSESRLKAAISGMGAQPPADHTGH